MPTSCRRRTPNGSPRSSGACWRPDKRAEAEEIERIDLDELDRMAQGPRHLQLLESLGVRSLVAVPLMARGRRVGAVAFVSARDTRRFDAEDLRFAEEFARIAALAIDNAQAYRAVKRAIAARDQVLGMVAHDLRNPLNSMLLQADLLRRPRGQPERRDLRPLEAIRRSAVRMDRLIDDILDVARLDAGTLAIRTAPQATRQLVEEAIEALRGAIAGAGLSLRVELPERLPAVIADRDRILQVFDNLIGNAIKATPRPGEIREKRSNRRPTCSAGMPHPLRQHVRCTACL
jgi:signal transduction histidine kinase